MRLEFSEFVESDLEAIAAFIAQGSPTRAVTFLKEIRAEILTIGHNPHLYQLRPDIGEDARMGVVGHYAILFRIVDQTVRIERVVWASRDLPGIFGGKTNPEPG